MSVVIAPLRLFRVAVSRLRQFEGWRCLWRVAAGGLILVAIPAMPVAAIVADAYLAGRAPRAVVAIVAVAVAALTALGGYVWRRRPWLAPVTRRLWSYECPDMLPWAIRVLVRQGDDLAAAAALRRAKFNPYSFLWIGSTPDDAPDLQVQISVVRPEAWHAPASDAAQVEEVAGVFRRAGIRARVAGVDVCDAAAVERVRALS
jgi:hypothetical protein